MKRLLILDDDPIRHDTWGRMFKKPSNEVIAARTFTEFEAALKTGKFDIIFLDFDLNDWTHLWKSEAEAPKREAGDVMFDPDGIDAPWRDGKVRLTGLHAARLVADLPAELKPNKVIVHSWNNLGALKIWNTIHKAGIPVRCKEFNNSLYFKEMKDSPHSRHASPGTVYLHGSVADYDPFYVWGGN